MKTKLFNLISRVMAVATIVSSFAMVSPVRGANLESMKDTMSRLKISVDANHEIQFMTPSGAPDTSSTIVITFASAFDLSQGPVAFGDIDVAYGDSTCSAFGSSLVLANAASATEWGAVVAGDVLTLTHPTDDANQDVPTDRCMQVKIGTNAASGVNQIVNPGSANTYEISVAVTNPVSATADAGGLAVAIVDDDQVVVTANVDPMLVFDIDTSIATSADMPAPYTVNFRTLTSTATSVSGETAQGAVNYIMVDLGTNATSGAVVTIQNTNGVNGMVSTSDGVDNIANANTTMANATENYGWCVQEVGQTSYGGASGLARAGAYVTPTCVDKTDGNTTEALATSAAPILSVVGPINVGRAVISGSAAASVLTEAHDDYTDTLTFIATATF